MPKNSRDSKDSVKRNKPQFVSPPFGQHTQNGCNLQGVCENNFQTSNEAEVKFPQLRAQANFMHRMQIIHSKKV